MRSSGHTGVGGDIRARRYRRVLNAGQQYDPMQVADRLFDVWALLPSQQTGGSYRTIFSQPVFLLWAASTIQAVLDYLEPNPAAHVRQEDATRWLFSEADGPRTFCWVANHFGIDVDAARTRLEMLRSQSSQRSLVETMARRN